LKGPWNSIGNRISILFFILAIAAVVPLWSGAYFPSQDGFAYTYAFHVMKDLQKPDSYYASFYERNVWFLPNQSYYFLHSCFDRFFGDTVPQKGVLTVSVLLFTAAVFFYARTLHYSLTGGALASLLLIHSTLLYKGFFTYLLGIPFWLCALSLLQSSRDCGFREAVLICLLGITAYFSHLMSVCLLILSGTIALFLDHRKSFTGKIRLILALLPCTLLVIHYIARSDWTGTMVLYFEPIRRTLLRVLKLGFFRGIFERGSLFSSGLILFWTIIGVLGTFAVKRWRVFLAESRHAIILAIVLSLIYLFCPEQIGAFGYVKIRFEYCIFLIILLSVPRLPVSSLRTVTYALIILLLAMQIYVAVDRGNRWNEFVRACIESGNVIEEGAFVHVDIQDDSKFFTHTFAPVNEHIPIEILRRRNAYSPELYHPKTPFYPIRNKTRSADIAPDYHILFPAPQVMIIKNRALETLVEVHYDRETGTEVHVPAGFSM
jgi:hypothetical protein